MRTDIIITLAAVILIGSASSQAAKRKTTPEPPIPVLLDSAAIAIDDYDAIRAESLLDRVETALDKQRKETPGARERMDSLRAELMPLRSMLDRVEQIAIIDSIAVSRDDFFKVYALSASAGALRGDGQLPTQWEAARPSTAYLTENGRTVVFAQSDSAGMSRLMETSLLSDGMWDIPLPMDDNLGEGGDANYPWLMTDGVTLYYANNGENSLGGYDIFITRRNGDGGFYQPQNVGFPYNSRYDDYMLAIDEEAGTGWWATDRNQLGDKITIYRFVTSDLRRNYPPDMVGLGAKARIDDWRSTQEPGVDYSKYAVLPEAGQDNNSGREFELALPDGRVLTRYDQLPAGAARELMRDRVDAVKQLQTDRRRLEVLRRNWQRGADENQIRSLEQELLHTRTRIKELGNQIISLL